MQLGHAELNEADLPAASSVSWIPRRGGPLAAVVVLAVIWMPGTLAQQRDIDLKVEVGFDGVAPGLADSATPVAVRIRNNGAGLEGALRISRVGMVPGDLLPVSLPEGGEKIVRRVVPLGASPEILVELYEGDTVIASASEFSGSTTEGLLSPALVVLDGRGPLPIRTKWNDVGRFHVEAIHPDLWALPDSALGYIGLGAVLWGRLSPDRLSLVQQRAIRLWVERGGTLIITPSRVASWKGSFLEDLTGMEGLVFGQEGSLDRLALLYQVPFPRAATAAVADLDGVDGDPLIGGDHGPLAVERRAGRGRVILLAFDPWVSPIPGWGGGQRFLTDLVCRPFYFDENIAWAYGTGSPTWARDKHIFLRHHRPGGGFGTTLLLGCLFALLVGPGLFVALRRLRRSGVIWAAVPAFSLLAALGAFAIGPVYSRVSSTALSATFLRLDPGSRGGTASRHFLYQSRARERHTLGLKGEGLGYSVGDNPSWWRPDPAGRVQPSLEGREKVVLDPLRVPRWGNRLVSAWADFELDGPIRAHLVLERDRMTLTVENGSTLDLGDVFAYLWYYDEKRKKTDFLDIGAIPGGGGFEEEVAIPDTKYRLMKGRLSPSGRVSKEVVRFLGGGSMRPSTLYARVDAREGERPIAAEYDEYTRSAGNFTFVQVPIEVRNDSGGHFFQTAEGGSTYLGLEDPDSETGSVHKEWFANPIQGECTVESMTIIMNTAATESDHEIFDWDRREWVTLPPGETKQFSSSSRTMQIHVTPPEPDRFLLRPEWVVVTRRSYALGRDPSNLIGKIESIQMEGTTGE